MIIACDTFLNAGDMINSWHAETGKHSYLQILRHATFAEWEKYSPRSSREMELAIKELTHYYEVAEVVRGNPILPITDSIIAWVKAELQRRALPLPPHGGGTRADPSLADAMLLVEEIERLRARSETSREVGSFWHRLEEKPSRQVWQLAQINPVVRYKMRLVPTNEFVWVTDEQFKREFEPVE
jgi:hypothetical protein